MFRSCWRPAMKSRGRERFTTTPIAATTMKRRSVDRFGMESCRLLPRRCTHRDEQQEAIGQRRHNRCPPQTIGVASRRLPAAEINGAQARSKPSTSLRLCPHRPREPMTRTRPNATSTNTNAAFSATPTAKAGVALAGGA